ncbi:MAG TPA: hypothetical protein VLB84_18400 [Bacteroidia bacterium]|nr:hypothetical protein [Bacteroidia bacterium]
MDTKQKLQDRMYSCLIVFLLMTLAVSALSAKNERDSTFVVHSNIVKMRILAPIWNGIMGTNGPTIKIMGIAYEYLFTKNSSISISMDALQQYYSIWETRSKATIYSDYRDIQFAVWPEIRYYPCNKRGKYPEGVHFGPSGNLALLKRETDTTSTWHCSGGVGASIGWQYFMGKRNRFVLDMLIGINVRVGVYSPVFLLTTRNESGSHVKGFIGTYLGYTFGKKPKHF